MSSKGRILVVDDDRLVLATVTHGLAQAGYEVIDADNGDDAILLARQHQPDLALLDIRMHGKTGFDVAEYLRDHAQVPFMFLSAFADDDTRAKVQSLGAVDYLVKPLDVDEIVPAVARAMQQVHQVAATPPSAAETAEAAVGAVSPLDVESVAIGILMHRFSLNRRAASERLTRQAGDQGVARAEQARRLLSAVEDLAAGG